MAFATILSVLAFCVSLIALWVAGGVAKKVEHQNEQFIRNHVNSIRDELNGLDSTIHKAMHRSQENEKNLKGMEKRVGEIVPNLDETSKRLRMVAEHVQALEGAAPGSKPKPTAKSNLKKTDKPTS